MRTESFFRLCLATEADRRSNWLDPEFVDPCVLAAMLERWANQAEQTIRTLPAEQVFDITYERLIGSPDEALGDLLRFVLGRDLSSHDDRWARQQALSVSPPYRTAPSCPNPNLTRFAVRARARSNDGSVFGSETGDGWLSARTTSASISRLISAQRVSPRSWDDRVGTNGADDGNRTRIISLEVARADFVSGVVTCEDVL